MKALGGATMASLAATLILVSACDDGEFVADGLGPLQDAVSLGEADGWTGSMDAGVYQLENGSNPTAIRYYYTGFTEGEGGSRSARVDVALEGAHPDARAGLLYGFRENPRFYYLIVASPAGEVEIYRREGPDFGMTMASSFEPTDTGYARIAVEENGSELAVRVNGEEVSSFQSEGVGSGSIGIAALGVGRFEFTNYRQTPDMGIAAPDVSRESHTTITTDQASSSELPSDALRLKRFDIVDHEGFGQPIVVTSFLAPADWQLEGGVHWNFQWRCLTDLVSMHARVVSPDGRKAFELFPNFHARWPENPMEREMTSQGGCYVAAPFDTANFVAGYFVPGFRQGASVVSSEPQQAVAQAAYEKTMQRYSATMRQLNAGYQVDAGRSRISYSGPSHTTEEWVLATVGVVSMPSLALHTTTAESVMSFRAPHGELDQNERLFSTIVGSVRVNPVYTNAVAAVMQRIQQIEQQSFDERMRIIRDSNRRMFNEWEASLQGRADDWKRQMDQQDRTHQRWNEAIRGTATFQDPESPDASYELTNDYEHVWRSGTDEIILTNDPNYNPNESVGGGWNPLRRVLP